MELLLFSIFLLLPISANSANTTLGSSLSATENSSPWLSDSGDFAFGFQQLKGQSDLFLLCIWYAKIPDKTIVWYASTEQPVPRQSKLNLTSDQGLVLTSLQGQELWKSEPLGLGDVSHGVMSDSGSFVLQSSSSGTLWESFQDPRDTLLPSQIIERGGLLASRQSETNYTKGRFQLRLQQDGNLVLNTINLTTDFANNPYYGTSTTDGTVPGSAGKQLVFNQSGYLYVLRENGGRFNLGDGNIVSARDNYLRATLSFDGIFVQYYHPKSWKGNVSWTTSWSIPDNICKSLIVDAGVGVCGLNSICDVNSDKRPTCVCPKGYSLLDPNDVYGDCKRDFIQKDNSTLPHGGSINKDHSRPAFLVLVIGSVLSGSSVLLFFFIFWFVYRNNHSHRKIKMVEHQLAGVNLRCFTYEELRQATDGFMEKLGRGAAGTVFKGILTQSSNEGEEQYCVAVKRLENTVTEDESEFKAEVSSIGSTHHRNIVRLLGFCNEGQHRLLVYEYMKNGSLANFLFGDLKLDWTQRREIALGTARGLLYLHEECSSLIIHCDIKPQNILVDDSFTARIADFGLAKLLKIDRSQTTTAIRGTKGYVAPEWFRNKPITAKVDVYSYGVLLLELICSRKSFDAEAEDQIQMVLSDWVYDCFVDKKVHLLLENDEEAMEDIERVEKHVMTAIWCIQEDPSLRPTMKMVIQMLEGTLQVSPPPDPCP